MPFRSEKQRKYLWKFHPDIAKRWTKEHGSKPVGKKKKKSYLEMIRTLVAQEVSVPQPAQPGQAPQGQTPAVPKQQFDLNTLTTMVPQIMGQLDSSDIATTRNYLVQNMGVDPTMAQQATTAFAVKIYNEEKAKRQNQVVQEVAKKMGLHPDVVKNWDKGSALPSLPGMQASIRKSRVAKIISSDVSKQFSKFAELDGVVEKVNTMSPQEKLKNLYNFFKNFGNISEGVTAIMEFVNQIADQLGPFGNQPPAAGGMTIANLSGKVGVVASLLWIVSFILILGAAGTSDFNARYWNLHPDKADEARAIILALKVVGAAGITTALANFFKKKEQPETPKRKTLYEGKL